MGHPVFDIQYEHYLLQSLKPAELARFTVQLISMFESMTEVVDPWSLKYDASNISEWEIKKLGELLYAVNQLISRYESDTDDFNRVISQSHAMRKALQSFDELRTHFDDDYYPGTVLRAWYANQVAPILKALDPETKP